MFPFLYLFIIVRRSGFEPEMPKPRFYRPLRYQFRSPTHINRQGEIRTHIVYHEGQNFTDSLLQPFAYLPLFNNRQSSNNSNNPWYITSLKIIFQMPIERLELSRSRQLLLRQPCLPVPPYGHDLGEGSRTLTVFTNWVWASRGFHYATPKYTWWDSNPHATKDLGI